MSRGLGGTAAPHLPGVDRVLGWAPVAALVRLHGRSAVLEAVRAELAALRTLRCDSAQPLRPGDDGSPDASRCAEGADSFDESAIAEAIAARVGAARAPSLRRVFNLTGTVLPTNLGRAPLLAQVLDVLLPDLRCLASADDEAAFRELFSRAAPP